MEFHYHDIERDVMILNADGGLNAKTAGQFVESIEKLVDAGLNKIIVDCTNLEYISSYGMSIIIRLHKRMKGRGGDVKLASVRGLVPQALSATKLDKLFHMYPDVERALLDFRKQRP